MSKKGAATKREPGKGRKSGDGLGGRGTPPVDKIVTISPDPIDTGGGPATGYLSESEELARPRTRRG